MELSEIPVTIGIIALNLLISFIGFNNTNFTNKLIMWPYGVKRNKEYYRFLSSGFLHADMMHLLFNMFTFFFFGANIENAFTVLFPFGKIWYIVLYLSALVVSDIPSYLKNQDNSSSRSLGASGAVSAVVFAAIVFSPWAQIRIYGFIKMSAVVFAILYVVYCIYASKKANDNVNHDAHLWGSVYGLIFTIALVAILRPDIFPGIIEELKNPSLFGR